MKARAITSEVILSSIRTRSDNSVGLSFSTPELASDEVLAFLELRNRNLKMLLQPMDGEAVELKEVKSELDEKTPAQRARAVLFLLWKQQNEAVEFETFYRQKMNAIIEQLKSKLNPT